MFRISEHGAHLLRGAGIVDLGGDAHGGYLGERKRLSPHKKDSPLVRRFGPVATTRRPYLLPNSTIGTFNFKSQKEFSTIFIVFLNSLAFFPNICNQEG